MSDKLLYPRPQAGDYDVHKAMHDLQENEGLFREFLQKPDEVLSRYPIDDEARILLKNHDYEGLAARGIHPIMIVQFQRHIEWGVRMTSQPVAG